RQHGRRGRQRPDRGPGVLDPAGSARGDRRARGGVGRAALQHRRSHAGPGGRDCDADASRSARRTVVSDSVTEQSETPEETPPTSPMELREGLPAVVETDEALAEAAAAIAAGSGPVAIDAERASGYRYSNRAYLIQLRREGSGT